MSSNPEASARRRVERLASGDLCSEPGCPNPRSIRGLCKTHYNKAGGYGPKNTERDKARQRAKTHLRKAVGRYTDVTPGYERALRDKAKRCPLCKVTLIKEPYLPASKELDHMVPLNVGGTHTIGNVRIICRSCNVRRPKDGSDYTGPVTLWAQDYEVAVTVTPTRLRADPMAPAQVAWQLCACGHLLFGGRHPWIPDGRSVCNPSIPGAVPSINPRPPTVGGLEPRFHSGQVNVLRGLRRPSGPRWTLRRVLGRGQ